MSISTQECPTLHASGDIAFIITEIILPILFEYLVFNNPYINENDIRTVDTVPPWILAARMAHVFLQCTQQKISKFG